MMVELSLYIFFTSSSLLNLNTVFTHGKLEIHKVLVQRNFRENISISGIELLM